VFYLKPFGKAFSISAEQTCMKSSLLVLCLSIFSTPLSAQDAFGKLYNLSENVRDVVLESPGGHPMPNGEFHLTTDQADQIKALSFLDDSMRGHLEDIKDKEVKKDCDESKEDPGLQKRVDNRHFQIEAAVFLSDTKFEQNAIGRFMDDGYLKYMGELSLFGNPKSADIYSIDALMAKYKSENPTKNLDALTFAEKEKVLNQFAEDYLGTKLPTGLLMQEMAFQEMVDNSSDWKSTLAVAKDKLSSQQKIELVSKFGGYFSNRYNYDRASGGSDTAGFVNTAELLDSVKNSTPGGVCRDIALAQVQILTSLGFDKSYVVAFKTLSSGHATVITTDPTTGKIVKFNYQDTYESKKGSGTEALVQDTTIPDFGLDYRVYDSSGKPVTHVASELSQILKEATGAGVDRDFSPRNFSLTNVGFKSAYANGNLFSGKTSAGEKVYGVALSKKMAIGEYLTVGAGAAFSKLEGTRSLYQVEQESLYFRANAELVSPKIKLGKSNTSAFLGGSGEIAKSHNQSTNLDTNQVKEANNQFEGNGEVYFGVKNSFKSPNQKFDFNSKAYASFYPDWSNVASQGQDGKKTLAFNSLVVKTGVAHQITDDTRALLDTAVILKNYGTSMVMKAAVEDDKHTVRYSAGMAMPLSREMPTFLPGGEKRAFIGVDKITKKMIFSIMYERNFDSNSNNVMLKAEIKL
jgi:hypothetical protein